MGQEAMQQHGVFSWNELMTSDLTAAKAFYSALLGWDIQDIQCSGMDYTMAKSAEREVAGMMTIPAGAGDMPPAWGAYVTVDDVDAHAARAEKLGGKICMGPEDIADVGRIAVIADPQGATLGLISYINKE